MVIICHMFRQKKTDKYTLYGIYKFLFSILFLELNALANNATAGAIIIGNIDANLILIKKANGIVIR
jgi:hypothetical protein